MSQEKLINMVPIRWIGMTWIPLLIVAFLPGGLFLNFIKLILLFWVLITIISVWKNADSWIAKGYETLQAFVTQNTILFAILLFVQMPSWVGSILILWMIIGFQTKFSQIKKANEVIEKLPDFNNKDLLTLEKYLGQNSYLLDERKLSLIKDRINLKQWAINMEFAIRGITPYLPSSLVSENNEEIKKQVSPKFEHILHNLLNSSWNYPKDLVDKNNLWFIAAYPDLLDFFYPSPDYRKKPIDDELKRVERNKKTVDPIMDDLIDHLQKKHKKPNFNIVLHELKDHYQVALNKSLLLLKSK